MIKVNLCKTFMFISMILLFISAYPTTSEAGTALVLYNNTVKDEAIALCNLLGHFKEYKTEHLNIEKKLVPYNKLDDYDVIFFISNIDSPMPPEKLKEYLLYEREKRTCYIGPNLWLFKELKGPYNTPYVHYKNTKIMTTTYNVYIPKNLKPDYILASFSDRKKGKIYPFIYRKGKNWFVSVSAFFDNFQSWIIADALHIILGVHHPHKKNAFIRLEDINPSYSGQTLQKLKECIDYLYYQGVPFSIAVYPVFRTSKKSRVITILQNKELIKVLQEAEKKGGTLIMHGVTHQYYYTSGEGSEFWDVRNDKPIPNQIKFFNKRIKYGLQLFKKAGLHPKLFEAPHYNFPLTLQFELKKYFTTIAGELMVNDKTYRRTQQFPYIIYNSYAGLTVLPEQLGYIASNAQTISIELIKEKVLLLSKIVRDPTACFFYHPFVAGDKYLKRLVPYIRSMGFDFIDIGKYGKFPDNVDISNIEHLWKIKKVKKFYYLKIIPIIAFIVSLISTIFFVIYIETKKKRKKELFE